MSSGRMPAPTDDFRAFLVVLRRALLMIVRWIEARVGTSDTE